MDALLFVGYSAAHAHDELVDMSGVTEIPTASTDRIKDLASLAATMDPKATSSRFAIVASADIAYGLGRMFQAYRDLNPKSTKGNIDQAVAMPEHP